MCKTFCSKFFYIYITRFLPHKCKRVTEKRALVDSSTPTKCFNLQRHRGRERAQMGRRPCCAKECLNKGAWSAREDKILTNYIKIHGEGKWRDLPQRAGIYNSLSLTGFILFSLNFIVYSHSWRVCRAEAMWKELPASMVELSKARYQER
jgi:hypothetical protein